MDEIYDHADALLMCSRLDPLPNVAIDALCRGVPVVSFAQATGLAEILGSIEDLEFLVVPYGDPISAAEVLNDLASSVDLKVRTQERICKLAEDLFDMND